MVQGEESTANAATFDASGTNGEATTDPLAIHLRFAKREPAGKWCVTFGMPHAMSR